MFPGDGLDPELADILISSKTTALPDEALTEIGRVVVNFVILESELFVLIHGLLGTKPEVSRIVTSELSFRNLVDLSASLMKQVYGKKEFDAYKKVAIFAIEAEEKRNRIIHSIWGRQSGEGKIAVRTKHTAKRGKGLDFQREEFTIVDISNIAHDISRAAYAVSRFRESLGYEWV